MRPTDLLKEEHRVIEQVLNVLEKMVKQSETEEKINPEHVNQVLDFFRSFADTCHHGKEEVHLFPMMESKGFQRDTGPTGVMMYEHEVGRNHIRGMKEAVDQYKNGDENALTKFQKHAASYIHLLREHISKEDSCLFPMADEAMNDEDQKSLKEKFDYVEHHEMKEGTHEKYFEIANRLADEYNVGKTEVSHATHSCSHH